MIRRNFDDPGMDAVEIPASAGMTSEAGMTRETRGKGSRIAALAFAVAAGAGIVASPTEAESQTGATFEWEKLDVTLHGTVAGGILHIAGETGGWFNKNKGTVRIPLKEILTPQALAALEGKEVDVEIEGKSEDGVFKPIVKIRTQFGLTLPASFSLNDLMRAGLTPPHCTRPDCTPRPRDCAASPCRAARRNTTPTRPPLSPEPNEAESGLLVRLKKPFDPGTFYVDKPDSGRSMGEGHPRGFDMPKKTALTFFVHGDPNGKTQVSIELYPWVHTDEKKRTASGKMKVKVTIDGEEYEILPQPLPKGKILPSSQTEKSALWDTPLRLPTIPVPPGTHEIVVTSDGYSFRAVLRGPTETAKPSVDAAIERPFEEDPATPPEFSVNARLVAAPDEPSGYQFKPITPSPVKLNIGAENNGLNVRIERLPNSPLVLIHLEKGKKGEVGHVVYISEKPLEPETDYRVRFTRVSPPARSFNAGDSPETLVLHIKVAVNAATGGVTGFEIDKSTGAPTLPDGMECRVNKADLFCSNRTADESRVRAYRTRLDSRPTNPAGNPRHHILRSY